jgi:hypothetical protein
MDIRLSVVFVSDMLDKDNLPIVFHLFDHISTWNISDTVNKFTVWERLQHPASECISPRIQITTEEADKAARDFTASIASAYKLSTSKITLSDLNTNIPSAENLLKHTRKLRKLGQVTRGPACKTPPNWVAKIIRRMAGRKTRERWGTKVGNCEITSQILWPTAKLLLKRDGANAPTSVQGLTYHPNQKANVIADCLQN